MKIYVVMIESAKAPFDVRIFDEKVRAISYAQDHVKIWAYEPEDIEIYEHGDYLYRARYCPEGSTVSVVEREVI